jgi:hypothetical protein
MKNIIITSICFITGLLFSCQSDADKPIIVHQEIPIKQARIKAATEKDTPAGQFFVPGTYVAFEKSHFQCTYDTVTLIKRKSTATIYDIKRSGAFIRLLDSKIGLRMGFSNTWMGSYDDSSNILFVITPAERWGFDPVKNCFTWKNLQYQRIE